MRPTTLVGTSVGAINTAYLAASAHLDAQAAIEGGLRRWRSVDEGLVLRPVVPYQIAATALRYLGEFLSIPGVRLPGLLDTAPLEKTLSKWIDWQQLDRNIDSGALHTAACLATRAQGGRSVAFTATNSKNQLPRSATVDYVSSRLRADHVRASASIPVMFPASYVAEPEPARGWYFDGATRFNTPIKPAIDLGVDRLVVVALEPLTHPGGTADGDTQPDFVDAALQALQAVLVDPLIADVRMLAKINLLAQNTEQTSTSKQRQSEGVRNIPYVFVGPRDQHAIGTLARHTIRSRYNGLKSLQSLDYPLLDRLLGRESPSHDALLSYLLFDRQFASDLIELGRQDAQYWLSSVSGRDWPWHTGPV